MSVSSRFALLPDGSIAHPDTRRSSVRRLVIGGTKLYLLTANFPDEWLVRIKIAKEGSTLSGFCTALGQELSRAASAGADELAPCLRRMSGMRFEPSGLVLGDRDIQKASSICDYLANRLARDHGIEL